jgi:hypothetical protein
VIVIAEIQLRFFSPVPIVPRYVTGTSFGIRGNMPNMNYWHKTPDVTINLRTNSKGIRADEEIPYEKPKDVKRIVVLGDSFGMGYEVNLEDTFLSRMKDNLEKAGKKVEIVNLSVSGHGNAEELIMFENEGVKYSPDLVLLCWHSTDLDDNIRSNLYVLKDGVLKRNARTYLPGVQVSDMLYKIPLFIPISENSHLYNLIRDEAGSKIKSLLLGFMELYTKLKGTQSKIDNNRKQSLEYSVTLLVALLKKIDDDCKNINAKLVILDIPDQKSRYEFISKFPSRRYKSSVVSPIQIFHKNVVKGELFINERSHFHFTPKACRLIGRTLSEYMINNKLMD